MGHLTTVYVDGFNLYYGCLKETPYRWLNLEKLCRAMLPQNDIQQIVYFTSPVRQRYQFDNGRNRQILYLRALATLPSVEIVQGHFLEHVVEMPLAGSPWGAPPEMVQVRRTEEKQTDVHLATRLIGDAWMGLYEAAVVVTNDTDQIPALRFVKDTLKYPLGVVFPVTRNPSVELIEATDFHKIIRTSYLEKSQFPYNMKDSQGRLDCPAEWRADYSPTGA